MAQMGKVACLQIGSSWISYVLQQNRCEAGVSPVFPHHGTTHGSCVVFIGHHVCVEFSLHRNFRLILMTVMVFLRCVRNWGEAASGCLPCWVMILCVSHPAVPRDTVNYTAYNALWHGHITSGIKLIIFLSDNNTTVHLNHPILRV